MLDPIITILGLDPPTTNRINSNAFQQSALTTFREHQYAAFYTSSSPSPNTISPRYVNLARRPLPFGAWEIITFTDYNQTADDGHNTISIGICTGDGTIHMSFDHHCDDLRYRLSVPGLASNPEKFEWSSKNFSSIQNALPGLESEKLTDVSYPRFVRIGNDMLFECRIGKAGAGSDVLYSYSSETKSYTPLGTYLVGISNNPYINGLDFRHGRLQVSWTYRHFIDYDEAANPLAHKVQAGPNGPENNASLAYAYSDDFGKTWKNSKAEDILKVDGAEGTILPSSKGIVVVDIPKNSGIMNQEAQVADWEGGFHVLNRDNTSGKEEWKIYYRDFSGEWKVTALPKMFPTETGPRGKLCVDRHNNLYAVLPSNTDTTLAIMKATKAGDYEDFQLVWEEVGFDGEPLIDYERLDEDGVLSVFTRTGGESGERKVIVLDFDISI